MSRATEVPDDRTADVRPVRRFVAAIAAIAAVLAALWWSGAVASRLGVDCVRRAAASPDRTVLQVTLRNQAPLPLTILGTARDDHLVDLRVLVDGAPIPAQGTRVPGWSSAAVELEWSRPGPSSNRPSPDDWIQAPASGLELVVGSAAGTTGSHWLGSLVAGAADCAATSPSPRP